VWGGPQEEPSRKSSTRYLRCFWNSSGLMRSS
jgi:hypothetical protein